jgi:NADP-dependent 3-hydroxy acid dehydrogenase YdfG
VQKTVERFGRVDFLVNSAGVTGEQGKSDGRGVQELDDVLGVNARGFWLMEREVIAQLLKQEERDVRFV